jgi:hypothetical protein
LTRSRRRGEHRVIENPSHREEQGPEPGPAGGANGASDPFGWQSILAAVAAAAGSAAWVSAVGSAVMGARLDNAGMPVESVISLMPAEQRFAIGVSHLLAPLFVGLLGFLADWALTSHRIKTNWSAPDRWIRRMVRPALAAVTIVIGAWVGNLLLEPPSLTLYMLQLAVIVIAVAAVSWFGATRGTSASERGTVFVLVLVLAGVMAFGFEVRQDPQFDFAAVRFHDSRGAPVAGYYVTTTSAAVLLITLGDEDDPQRCPATTRLRRISALPVGDIDRVWIGPRTETFDLGVYCKQKKIALSDVVP